MLLALTLATLVRVVAPADDAALTGGSPATIEWAESAPLPAEVEEWEAFLSVDGGRYYAARLTPHLDRGIRRFTFVVPNVTSRDARILLRFGDEERETEVELPLRLTVRFDPLAPRARVDIAEEEGEPARDGDEPVAEWMEGERDGTHLRHVAPRKTSFGGTRARRLHLPAGGDADEWGQDELALPRSGIRTFTGGARKVRYVSVPREEHDPLLDTLRLNI